MIYGLVLAAGLGTRMGLNCPKALIKIKNKPIFVHSLKVFINSKKITKVYVACHPGYISKYEKIIEKYFHNDQVKLMPGDIKGRQESLKKSISFIQKENKLNTNDLIVTHDCARINLTNEILLDSINVAIKKGYSTAAIKMNDSLFDLSKNKYIDRKEKYQIQTPQTFKFKYWKTKATNKSTDLFSYLNLKITKDNLSIGSIFNYKITEKLDLKRVQKNQ